MLSLDDDSYDDSNDEKEVAMQTARKTDTQDIPALMRELASNARAAYQELATSSNDTRNAALKAAANALRGQTADIRQANGKDVAAAEAKGLSKAMLDRLLLTFRDLTPIRQVEEMRVDFVANASHELRTPLAALSGFIETLKGPARNDAAARERFLDIMEAQARRMARLIDDLLSLSRIELAAHVRPQTPVDLLPIVRQVIDALQMLARDRGVDVNVTAPSEPLVVSGDRDELTRVFENLVENALKYGASGRRVEIALSRAFTVSGGEEAVVAVRDYGPGIAAEHMPRLTERFYRVDVTESREQGGTGLGLALVKHIMNRHRGRLTIESRSGEGATFTVRLALSQAAAPPKNQ